MKYLLDLGYAAGSEGERLALLAWREVSYAQRMRYMYGRGWVHTLTKLGCVR